MTNQSLIATSEMEAGFFTSFLPNRILNSIIGPEAASLPTSWHLFLLLIVHSPLIAHGTTVNYLFKNKYINFKYGHVYWLLTAYEPMFRFFVLSGKVHHDISSVIGSMPQPNWTSSNTLRPFTLSRIFSCLCLKVLLFFFPFFCLLCSFS